MFSTGQSCVSSKRIIVIGKERGKAFLEQSTAKMASLRAGSPDDAATTLGPISSERALDLLLKQIDQARHSGAKVVLGGHRIDRPGFYIEPTILTGIDKGNPVYSQELFGPVASFYVVENEKEAIALANDTPFGLGASVLTRDIAKGQTRRADRERDGVR